MMDTYQAVYEATRSRISPFDGNRLIDEIRSQFDISHSVEMVKYEFFYVASEMRRPSVLMKPKVYPDGDEWCAMYGDDVQKSVTGFGDSPEKAMIDFDKNWVKSKKEK